MRLEAIIRPGVSLTVAADVLAGYVLAAPALPSQARALVPAPLLCAAAFLLISAGGATAACFAETLPRAALKRAFILAMGLASLGIMAAMAAGVSVGHMVIYPAAMLFLLNWARSAGRSDMPLAGPLGAGAARALCLALGMSAHAEALHSARPEALAALALYFAYGALVETLEQSQAEGGRRYSVTFAFVGLLTVFVASAAHLTADSPLRIVGLAGAGFLAARAVPAIRTLTPGAIARFTEAAYVAALFLNASVVWGRWHPEGPLLAMGAAILLLVPVAVVLFGREESLEKRYA